MKKRKLQAKPFTLPSSKKKQFANFKIIKEEIKKIAEEKMDVDSQARANSLEANIIETNDNNMAMAEDRFKKKEEAYGEALVKDLGDDIDVDDPEDIKKALEEKRQELEAIHDSFAKKDKKYIKDKLKNYNGNYLAVIIGETELTNKAIREYLVSKDTLQKLEETAELLLAEQQEFEQYKKRMEQQKEFQKVKLRNMAKQQKVS